uniref:C2H2-type domain-containing protein n=1 Tax=Terrapene triunguis TaxID=2587831 RepID=A0A674JXT9_9SAUR
MSDASRPSRAPAFPRLWDLRPHARSPPQGHGYGCPTCGKAFARSSALLRHEAAHRGEKPFRCAECGKGFAYGTASQLTEHQRVHTGERPYLCSVCGKTFAYSFLLRRHLKIHTGERPYPCPECPKAFKTSGHLQKHRLIHTRDSAAGGRRQRRKREAGPGADIPPKLAHCSPKLKASIPTQIGSKMHAQVKSQVYPHIGKLHPHIRSHRSQIQSWVHPKTDSKFHPKI